MTAEDFCFTVEALLDPGTESWVADRYKRWLTGCEVVDGEAVIGLTKAYPDPQERVAFRLLPEHRFESTALSPTHPFARRPVGTGPMRGELHADEVDLSAVPGRTHTPHLDRMLIVADPDPRARVAALLADEVDGVIDVPPAYRPSIAVSDDIALKSYDLRSWWYVAVNTRHPPLDQLPVRRALELAVDRADLRAEVIGVDPDDPNPPCEFVSGPFVQSSPYYNRQVKVRTGSERGAARAALAEAGYQAVEGVLGLGRPALRLRLGMPDWLEAEVPGMVEALARQWDAIGVDVEVVEVAEGEDVSELDLLVGRRTARFVEDVDDLFHSDGENNVFGWSDPTTDRLVDTFRSTTSDTEARDATHELHTHLAEALPMLFLWKLDTKSAWHDRVRNNTIVPLWYWTNAESWRLEP